MSSKKFSTPEAKAANAFAKAMLKASMKRSIKRAPHFITWHVVLPYAFEYGIVLVLTMLINATLFHGRLNTPAVALGFQAIGILVRYFGQQKTAKQQARPGSADISPELLSAILSMPPAGSDIEDESPFASAPGPYL